MKFKIFLITLLFAFVSVVQAVDTDYNKGTVKERHAAGKWHYNISVTIDSVASGDIVYTPAIFIPQSAATYEYLRVVASNATGTEDFNIFPVYMSDPRAAVANFVLESTDSDLDAVSTTAVEDTLGIVQGTASKKHKIYPWVCFKIVNGQAVSAATITLDIGGDTALGVDVNDIPSPVNTKEE